MTLRLLVVAVATAALAGYSGHMLYPRFDLPQVEGVAILGLGAAAGRLEPSGVISASDAGGGGREP